MFSDSFLLGIVIRFYLSYKEIINIIKRVLKCCVHSYHPFHSTSVDEDFLENLAQDETSKLDLGFEEWDIAGLPWWFLGNLRNNYTPRSNGSTDLQTNQVNLTFEEELFFWSNILVTLDRMLKSEEFSLSAMTLSAICVYMIPKSVSPALTSS